MEFDGIRTSLNLNFDFDDTKGWLICITQLQAVDYLVIN